MSRDLSNTSTADTAATTPDLEVAGDPDAWELVCKASSAEQGWSKSTKRRRVPGGWLYQVSTEHRSGGAVVACAEALALVPDPGQPPSIEERRRHLLGRWCPLFERLGRGPG